MTKDQLIGLIKLNLGNVGNLHGNQIHLDIAMAWEQMLFAVYAQMPGMLDRFAVQYKDQPVVKEESTGTYYCELPITPLRFVDIAEGLRRITKLRQRSNTTRALGDDIIFVPMPVGQTQLISNVDAGMVSDVIGWYIRDEKVWFYHMQEDIISVNMDIVPSFDKLDYEAEVVIPAGGVQMLIGITQEILKGVPYVDPRLRKINLQQV